MEEITGEILDRLHAMEAEAPTRDLEYVRGLGNAVTQGAEYAIEVIAVGEDRAPPIPVALTAQARIAARHRIPFEVVIQRYSAGKGLLESFLLEEASLAGISDATILSDALAAQAAAFDRVLGDAGEEYQREERSRITSPEAHRVDRVQRLLAGERVDPSSLEYDLDAHHLGLVALSAEARPLIHQLARKIGGRALMISPSEDGIWAWVGGRNPVDPEVVRSWVRSDWPKSTSLGIGEPSQARSGWRRTHEQALRAVRFSRIPSEVPVAWYRDIALIECASRDHVFAAFLRSVYLSPLAEEGKRGEAMRETLHAYFAADQQGSAAAAALGVSRQTVRSRLRQVEQCLGQPLSACGEALTTALRLASLEDPPST